MKDEGWSLGSMIKNSPRTDLHSTPWVNLKQTLS